MHCGRTTGRLKFGFLSYPKYLSVEWDVNFFEVLFVNNWRSG